MLTNTRTPQIDSAVHDREVAVLRELGVKLPKPIVEAIEVHHRYLAAFAAVGPNARDGVLADAIVAAARRGESPASDPDVRAALAAPYIIGALPALERFGARDFDQAVEPHAAALIEQLVPRFDMAAEKLRETAEGLGVASIADAEAVLRSGPAAAEHWAAAVRAEAEINAVLRGWQIAARWGGLALAHATPMHFVYSAPTREQAARLPETPTPYAVVAVGAETALAAISGDDTPAAREQRAMPLPEPDDEDEPSIEARAKARGQSVVRVQGGRMATFHVG